MEIFKKIKKLNLNPFKKEELSYGERVQGVATPEEQARRDKANAKAAAKADKASQSAAKQEAERINKENKKKFNETLRIGEQKEKEAQAARKKFADKARAELAREQGTIGSFLKIGKGGTRRKRTTKMRFNKTSRILHKLRMLLL